MEKEMLNIMKEEILNLYKQNQEMLNVIKGILEVNQSLSNKCDTLSQQVTTLNFQIQEIKYPLG